MAKTIKKNPAPIWFVNPETGDVIEFNFNTAKFGK